MNKYGMNAAHVTERRALLAVIGTASTNDRPGAGPLFYECDEVIQRLAEVLELYRKAGVGNSTDYELQFKAATMATVALQSLALDQEPRA
jgi:hypothetical protein